MKFKKRTTYIIAAILILYSFFGAFNTLFYVKELKSISLPEKEVVTDYQFNEMTEQDREIHILKKYKYNYIELKIRNYKFYVGLLGVTSVITFFTSLYLFGKQER